MNKQKTLAALLQSEEPYDVVMVKSRVLGPRKKKGGKGPPNAARAGSKYRVGDDDKAKIPYMWGRIFLATGAAVLGDDPRAKGIVAGVKEKQERKARKAAQSPASMAESLAKLAEAVANLSEKK